MLGYRRDLISVRTSVAMAKGPRIMADDSPSSSSLDALRAAQEQALHRMGDAWRLITKTAGVVPVPGGKDVGQYLQQLMDAGTTVVAATSGPLRKLVDAQRELADRLERWGDMQSEMADLTRGIATQQRVVAEVLSQVLVPLDLARENLSGDAAKAAKAGEAAAEDAASGKGSGGKGTGSK
jgi:hypothetical protein